MNKTVYRFVIMRLNDSRKKYYMMDYEEEVRDGMTFMLRKENKILSLLKNGIRNNL